jgi:hypothetical protein
MIACRSSNPSALAVPSQADIISDASGFDISVCRSSFDKVDKVPGTKPQLPLITHQTNIFFLLLQDLTGFLDAASLHKVAEVSHKRGNPASGQDSQRRCREARRPFSSAESTTHTKRSLPPSLLLSPTQLPDSAPPPPYHSQPPAHPVSLLRGGCSGRCARHAAHGLHGLRSLHG